MDLYINKKKGVKISIFIGVDKKLIYLIPTIIIIKKKYPLDNSNGLYITIPLFILTFGLFIRWN